MSHNLKKNFTFCSDWDSKAHSLYLVDVALKSSSFCRFLCERKCCLGINIYIYSYLCLIFLKKPSRCPYFSYSCMDVNLGRKRGKGMVSWLIGAKISSFLALVLPLVYYVTLNHNVLIYYIYILQDDYHHSLSYHLQPLHSYHFLFVVRTFRFYSFSNI